MFAWLEWVCVVPVIPVLPVRAQPPALGGFVWAPERLLLAPRAARMLSVCMALAERTTNAPVTVTQTVAASLAWLNVSLVMMTKEMKTVRVAVS